MSLERTGFRRPLQLSTPHLPKLPPRVEPNVLPPTAARSRPDRFSPSSSPVGDASIVPPTPPAHPARQSQAVSDAIAANGVPVPFTNSDGRTEQLAITRQSDTRYDVRVGDTGFQLEVTPETDLEAFLPGVIDAYSETPAHYRDTVHTIRTTAESRRTDTNQAAAAAAGDHTITYYEHGIHSHESVFHHEAGHLVGDDLDASEHTFDEAVADLGRGLSLSALHEPPIPDGWTEAAEADGNFLSTYSEADFEVDGDYTEDFADAWSQYMQAIDSGDAAVQDFHTRYPRRAEILAELLPAS